MEGCFDSSHGALDLHIHSIARAANDLESVGFGKANDGVVIIWEGPNLAVNSCGVTKCRYDGLVGS